MKKFFFNIKKYYKYAIRSAKAELKSEVSDSYLNWLWWIIETTLLYAHIYIRFLALSLKMMSRILHHLSLSDRQLGISLIEWRPGKCSFDNQ